MAAAAVSLLPSPIGSSSNHAFAQPEPTPALSGTPGPSGLVLYDGSIGQGFQDGSFGYVSRNPCDASVTYTGACSYAIRYAAWGALNFQVLAGTLNTAGYTALEYTVHPGGQPISDLGVVFTRPTGAIIKQVVLSSRDSVQLEHGWLRVSIALSRLNPSHAPVGTIQLKNEQPKSLRTVHYQNVTLLGAATGPGPFSTAAPTATATVGPAPKPTAFARPPLLPGQKRWKNGVSSYLFGSNDSEEWSPDNVQTDPDHIIQSSMKTAHFTLERIFLFHYSIRDGHRTSIGTHPRIRLNAHNRHEFDRPAPPPAPYTGPGYEVENRIRTVEKMGMHCLGVLPNIWTTPAHNVDPNLLNKRVVDPDTGKPETDLDFARKVVAYLGNRCNMYEIGNEEDLDSYTQNGLVVRHMYVKTYVSRWKTFVGALRKINPRAKFIGPVTYNEQGNDCSYSTGTPYRSSQPGDCYMQNFLHGVKGTKFEPDAVSFHWYPCDAATLDNCTASAWNSYARVTNEVRGWIKSDLGRVLPVGITEWNFDPGGNTALGSNGEFMSAFSKGALASMISAKLDFAAQFDTQSFGGYGALDMFDMHNGDRPKAQFDAVAQIIKRYRR